MTDGTSQSKIVGFPFNYPFFWISVVLQLQLQFIRHWTLRDVAIAFATMSIIFAGSLFTRRRNIGYRIAALLLYGVFLLLMRQLHIAPHTWLPCFGGVLLVVLGGIACWAGIRRSNAGAAARAVNDVSV